MAEALRTQLEDAAIAAIRPLATGALGGNGYIECLQPYQGSLSPTEVNAEDIKRVTGGRSPAVLVTTGDESSYDIRTIGHDDTVEATTLEILLVAKSERSAEHAARGDAGQGVPAIDQFPGMYKMIEDVRARAMGNLDVDCIGSIIPRRSLALVRSAASDPGAIWLLSFDVNLLAETFEPVAEDYTEIATDINNADDDAADPVVEMTTTLLT